MPFAYSFHGSCMVVRMYHKRDRDFYSFQTETKKKRSENKKIKILFFVYWEISENGVE